MDQINLKGLRFYAFHGAMSEENVLGQEFIIDLTLEVDLEEASKSDDVKDTVHYGMVYENIKGIIENERYDLIEKLAGSIIDSIFEEFKLVKELEIEVKKPQAPVQGIFDYFSVKLRRKR